MRLQVHSLRLRSVTEFITPAVNAAGWKYSEETAVPIVYK